MPYVKHAVARQQIRKVSFMDYKNGAGDGNKRFLFYYRGQSALCVHHNNNLKKIYWSACSFK